MADKESSSSEVAPAKAEEKKSWADVAEEEESEAELKLKELTVSDNNGSASDPGLLEDPDDSQIKAVVSGDTVYASALKFEDLNLSDDLIKGLYVEMGFSRPSKIQAVTLPMILTPPYKDLVAQAHNGSGKTTCFVLGMLSRVDPHLKVPQAICICPTRELAQQNQSVLLRMGKFSGITSMCAIPSESSNFVPISKRPPITEQVVIGTPGTIKKWMSARKLATRDVKILVFDEADHMLAEDGFRDDSERIMKDIQRSSGHCQVLLFSATFNETVKAFVSKVVKDGNQIFVKKEELTLEKLKQYKVRCPDELAKLEVIKDKIFEFGQKIGQTIIFVRTRESTQRLHKTLVQDGYECTSIQGAMEQGDRDKIIKEFKDGLTKVLLTTDLLARGFDQAQVNLVINYDLPIKYGTSEPDYEVYLHRIGRAGRFGRKGAVFNLVCTDRDQMIMEKIEKHFAHYIPEVPNWRSEEDFEKALKDAGLL
ncbi:ATP-dependent RNA helicase DBP5 [Rhynchospora pubera]|uniref:RNA helicase n=1 Tax=Rhynchospora pubera TaxID=906938 RepID=A0AAV8FCQ7_9POAL|nr:ATP-dependent RNA helicase DBP5 [Rhynchospora pubera]KAJ4814655.1 ATP-dependent RNA helicase DBP5 [Rhynchospora pubera]